MIIGKDTHLYRQPPAEPNLSDLNLSCSFCLFLSCSINPLHLWPASARSRASLLIDALVWLKSSSDYHYRRAFWKEKITFCLSWPWREVQEDSGITQDFSTDKWVLPSAQKQSFPFHCTLHVVVTAVRVRAPNQTESPCCRTQSKDGSRVGVLAWCGSFRTCLLV